MNECFGCGVFVYIVVFCVCSRCSIWWLLILVFPLMAFVFCFWCYVVVGFFVDCVGVAIGLLVGALSFHVVITLLVCCCLRCLLEC